MLSWYRYRYVAWLNQLIGSQASSDNRISNDNAYINKQYKHLHIFSPTPEDHSSSQKYNTTLTWTVYNNRVSECSSLPDY